MNVYQLSEVEARELLQGTEARFVHGEMMTVAYWHFEPGVVLPEHAHPHEQILNVIQGEFALTVDGATRRLGSGSVVVIPPDAVHAGRAVTDCRIIDVFHPVREDFR
jgi:quercetin dioxygenase-like cupin family protein